MQNLIYLIIMVLAGGAGWMAGSWSGKADHEALAKVEKSTADAKAAFEKTEAGLRADLASQRSQAEAERQKLAADHAAQTAGFKALIAGNGTEIDRLKRSSADKAGQIKGLMVERDAAKTPEARKVIDDKIKVVEADRSVVVAEISGRECLPVAVPLPVLAPWRGGQP
jgi:hypothetical protein